MNQADADQQPDPATPKSSGGLQFSIVDILWLCAAVATIVWILSSFRALPQLACLTAAFLAVWAWTIVRLIEKKNPVAFLFFLAFSILYGWLGEVYAVMVAALFSAIALVLVRLLPDRLGTRSFARWAAVGIILTFELWLTLFPSPWYVELVKMRQLYPIEDLTNRLAYETQTHNPPLAPQPLAPSVQSLLDFSDVRMPGYAIRASPLQSLHRTNNDPAMRALYPPFISMRSPLSNLEQSLNPIVSIPFKRPQPSNQSAPLALPESDWNFTGEARRASIWEGPQGRLITRFDSGPISQSALNTYHFHHHFDFLHPAGWGYFPDRTAVTGFLPHAFHFPAQALTIDGAVWPLEWLHLISMTRSDSPRVYIADSLPRMDELSRPDAATRPLDTWEKESISQLITASDIVFFKSDTELRMLGSLRASDLCLNCHHGTAGQLLGVFTYRFLSPHATTP